MKLTISNQTITITEALDLVADTENVYEVEYEFGDEWDGYSRTAVFEGCGSTYQVVLTNTNKCDIPNEILADSGYVRFGVLGTKVDGSISLRYPTVWSEKVWVDVASIGTGTPSEPTAEVYAQILANEDAIEDRLDDAEADIDTLQEEAHTHSNKALLDTYAQTESDLASAVSLKHTHSNKSVLDAITSALVSAWTTASTWVTTNGATLLAHIADSTIHTTSSEKATWNGKQNQLTAGTNITIVNDVISATGGSSSGGAFIATYGTTTASEIASAITAGKAIFCSYSDGSGVSHQLMLVDESNSKYGFAESTVGTNDDITSVAGITIALNKQDNTWEVYTGSGSIPTKTSDLENDSGFLTEHQSLANYYTKTQTDDLLDDKVNTTENSLTTTDKTVVGAINELNSGKEASDNKVTSISTSSTDTQYPSAKAVMTELKKDRLALDNRIKKFYTSNLLGASVSDSDDGEIRNIKIWGRGSQGSSPSPSSPQAIHSVVSPTMKVCGKNLCNTRCITQSSLGVTFTNNGDGTGTLNGTATGSGSFRLDQNDYGSADNLHTYKGTYTVSKTSTLYTAGIMQNETWQVELGAGEGETSHSGTIDADNCFVLIMFSSGVTFNNVLVDVQVEVGSTATDFEAYKSTSATLSKTLNAIPVSSGGNVTIDGQQYIADYVDVEAKKIIRKTVKIASYNGETITEPWLSSMDVYVSGGTPTTGATVVYALATATEESLTDAEVADFLAMRSYYPTTNHTVTSTDLSTKAEFIYPCSLEDFVEYVKTQLGDTRTFIYNIDDLVAQAYIDAQYALVLAELS